MNGYFMGACEMPRLQRLSQVYDVDTTTQWESTYGWPEQRRRERCPMCHKNSQRNAVYCHGIPIVFGNRLRSKQNDWAPISKDVEAEKLVIKA